MPWSRPPSFRWSPSRKSASEASAGDTRCQGGRARETGVGGGGVRGFRPSASGKSSQFRDPSRVTIDERLKELARPVVADIAVVVDQVLGEGDIDFRLPQLGTADT